GVLLLVTFVHSEWTGIGLLTRLICLERDEGWSVWLGDSSTLDRNWSGGLSIMDWAGRVGGRRRFTHCGVLCRFRRHFGGGILRRLELIHLSIHLVYRIVL